jgi:hypothetical protein
MIRFKVSGDYSKANKYMTRVQHAVKNIDLTKYAERGVAALVSATPVESGKTANSWYYTIEKDSKSATINFNNSNIQNGVPIAIILQYGHGTGTGGWVQGRDYINPAIQPVFDEIANSAWKEVTKL